MNYEVFSNAVNSNKVVLCKARAKSFAKIFTDETGGVYSRESEVFISKVFQDDIELLKASSSALNEGEFFYSPIEAKLYVRTTDSSNPKENNIILENTFFFSDKSFILPNDLNNGDQVEFQPLIKSIGDLKLELDFEQTGVALESDSSISLENTHGFFDNIIDTLIWENQEFEFFSWSPSIPVSEARLIYRGFVRNKEFNDTEVKFSLRDDIVKLRKPIQTEVLTSNDGVLSDSDIGKIKPRLYGRIERSRMIGVDKVLNGYPLTGLISGQTGNDVITGSSFFKEVSVGDRIIFNIGNLELSLSINQVLSDTEIELSEEIPANFINTQAVIQPDVPYRFKNREWIISGHKLFTKEYTIQSITTLRVLELDTTESLLNDFIVTINGERREVERVSGNTVFLKTNLSSAPVLGDKLILLPVFNVFYGSRRLVETRDFELENDSTSKIILNPLAEFNVTTPRRNRVSFLFTNGSREIEPEISDTDFSSLFRVRDWINSGDLNHNVWYEIIDVQDEKIIIREEYDGANTTSEGLRKNVEYIEDETLMTISCLGVEQEGKWIRRPAEVVKHLIENDANIQEINEASFTESINDCDYLVSYPITESKKIREAISDVNNSCFGSLYQDVDFKFKYSILNSDRDTVGEVLRDDDILSWRANTRNNIINKVFCQFRPFTDIFNGDDAFLNIEIENSFVNQTSSIEEEKQIKVFLYNEADSRTIAERFSFFNSLSQGLITINSKLNLTLKNLNDQISFEFKRLFKRYGSEQFSRIGIINSVSKNGSSVTIVVNDLSGVYNRVKSISEDDTEDYSLATENDILNFGFIVDDDTETPDNNSEVDLGSNLIG